MFQRIKRLSLTILLSMMLCALLIVNIPNVFAEDLPDLVPTALTGPTNVEVGQQMTFYWTVQNQGTADAAVFTDYLHVSNDQTLDSSDYGTAWIINNNGLAAGESYQDNVTPFAPNMTGTYYFILEVDMEGDIVESNEDNNTLVYGPVVVTQPNADLVPTSFDAPTSIGLGQDMTISWTVSNQGRGDAGAYYDAIILSSKPDYNPGDFYTPKYSLAEVSTDGLGAGEYITHTITIPFIALPELIDSPYLILVVDAGADVWEDNEQSANTMVIGSITVHLADLVPTALSAPSELLAGQEMEISWDVYNQGLGNAQPHLDYVYLSQDSQIDSSDTLIAADFISEELAANGSYHRSYLGTVPTSITPGNYYLILNVDIAEDAFEDNNSTSNNTFIFAPLSVVIDPTPTADAGGPYTVEEFGTFLLTGTGSDPYGRSLTYTWYMTDRAYAKIYGQSMELLVKLDGPYTQDYTLEVCNMLGLCASDHATLTVSNVAPTVDAGSDYTLIEGEMLVSAGSFTDPCSFDTWTATVDYGDGSGTQALSLNGNSFSLSHSYTVPGNYTLTVQVTDDDGGVGIDTATIEVLSTQQAVGNVVNDVTTLTNSGTLSTDQSSGLTSKLEAALESIDTGNPNAAINKLEAFINQVNALINAGALSPTEGQALIDEANRLIATL